MSESLNESQSPLQLQSSTLISMAHLHMRWLCSQPFPIVIDACLNVPDCLVLSGGLKQVPEPALELRYSSTDLRLGI